MTQGRTEHHSRYPRLTVKESGDVSPFVLGVQYYGPQHTDESDWHKDFPRIKEHGLDTLRLWAFWGDLEPSPGEYAFDGWETLFDVADRYGLSLLPNMVMEIQPFWVHRIFPDACMYDQYSRPILSTSGEYSCGVSPGVCFDHDEPRARAEELLERFARHFKDRPNLLGWDAWCETRWTDNMNERVHNREAVRMACYCDRTVAGFRSWLESRYGSLDGVNRTWRRTYREWIDVFPPRGGWWSYAYPEMVDWREYMIDQVTDKLTLRANALRKGDPTHPVVMHAGISCVLAPHFINERGSDDWRLAREVDLYGTSCYPVRGREPDALCLGLDAIRSASGSKPFWIGELQGGGAFHSPFQRGTNYYPADIRFWTWVCIAYGAKGILYWSWRPEPFGPQTFGFGMNHFDGTLTDRTRMVRDVSAVIKRIEPTLLQAQPKPSEVGLLFDPALYIIDWNGGTGGMVCGMSNRSLHGYYQAFWNTDIPCDVVHAGLDSKRLARYKLLVLPFAFCLRKEFSAHLTEYVRNGGVVISEAYLGRFRESAVPSERFPSYGLDAVFGVRGTEAEFVEETDIRPLCGEGLFAGVEHLTGRFYKDLLELLPKARALAVYPDGKPALVEHHFGKGRTYVFASLLALEHDQTEDPRLDRWLANLARSAGITPVATAVATGGGNVKTRVFTEGHTTQIHCLNFGAACDVQLRIHLPPPAGIREMLTDTPVPFRIENGHLSVALALKEKDVQILCLEPVG